MVNENVCVVCGITEEKAKERGDIVEDILVEEEFLLGAMKVKTRPGNFLCLECKSKIYNVATQGKLGFDTDKMNAFTEFVGSSAALFNMETALVVQACFNITMSGVVSGMSLDLGLKILNTMRKVVDKNINDLSKKVEEKRKREGDMADLN